MHGYYGGLVVDYCTYITLRSTQNEGANTKNDGNGAPGRNGNANESPAAGAGGGNGGGGGKSTHFVSV